MGCQPCMITPLHPSISLVRPAPGAFSRPDHKMPRPARAEAVKAGPLQGHPKGSALRASSTMARSHSLGSLRGLERWLTHFPDLEVAAMMQHAPGDARELVGERDCQHVVVQALGGRLDPGLEAVALPAGGPQQHDTGGLHE